MTEWVQALPVPPLPLWLLVLALGLLILVKASDAFTDAADHLGRSVGLPAFVVGVTIVAVGTSLPELITSVLAVLRDASEIVTGNVVGSNVTNLLLILGLVGVQAGRLRLQHEVVSVDLPFLAGSTFLLAAFLWDGTVTRGEALFALAGLVLYLHYSLKSGRVPVDQRDPDARDGRPRAVAILVVGALLIWAGAEATVTSVIELAALLDIGSEVIAASAVALGTSLPEVSVSISATRRGQGELAVGNILGSNAFNAFAVIGVAGLLGPLAVPDPILTFALPIMVIAMLLVFGMIMEKELTLWEGWLLLLFYAYFLGALLGLI